MPAEHEEGAIQGIRLKFGPPNASERTPFLSQRKETHRTTVSRQPPTRALRTSVAQGLLRTRPRMQLKQSTPDAYAINPVDCRPMRRTCCAPSGFGKISRAAVFQPARPSTTNLGQRLLLSNGITIILPMNAIDIVSKHDPASGR